MILPDERAFTGLAVLRYDAAKHWDSQHGSTVEPAILRSSNRVIAAAVFIPETKWLLGPEWANPNYLGT